MTPGSSTQVLSQQRAKEFADKWQHTEEEERYAKSFWTDFFRQLCGVDDEKIAEIYINQFITILKYNEDFLKKTADVLACPFAGLELISALPNQLLIFCHEIHARLPQPRYPQK